MSARAILVVVLATSSARADELSPHFYADASAWTGVVRVNGSKADETVTPVGFGVAIGAAFLRERGLVGRVGMTLDLQRAVFPSRESKAQYLRAGLEGELDWNLISCWRIGARLAVVGATWGPEGGGSESDVAIGAGTTGIVGLRIRNHAVTSGLDLVRASFERTVATPQGDEFQHSTGRGILFGVGATGRPGKYFAPVTAVVMVLIAVVVAIPRT